MESVASHELEPFPIQSISPSHSFDSGIDESVFKVGDGSEKAPKDLFDLLDADADSFENLDGILKMDDFLRDSFWEDGDKGDYDKISSLGLLPFLESVDDELPKEGSSSVSRSSSVELDHSYVVSKSPTEASVTLGTGNVERRVGLEAVCDITDRTPSFSFLESSKEKLKSENQSSAHDSRVDDARSRTVIASDADKSRKNAENARLNRQRKKRYVENLEREIKSLRTANSALMAERKEHKDMIEDLEDQLSCLKNVLANDSTLSSIMKSITSTAGLTFSNSCPQVISPPKRSCKRTRHSNTSVSNKRSKNRISCDTESASNSNVSEQSSTTNAGGICLHVRNDVVSLALCTACSKSANGN